MSEKNKNFNINPVLNSILHHVEKPGRYIGNEIYAVKKDWESVDVAFALFFPDLYELGMSYLGFQILYHILNRNDFIAAERVFSPWPDFESQLREKNIPLFSLETRKPVCSFDIVGFTLQYELHATNIINGLDLSRIPVISRERGESEPIVVGGGPNAANPEPLADFFDAFVIGDGEKVVVELADIVRDKKRFGWTRFETLKKMAQLEGVYIPGFFRPVYNHRGTSLKTLPNHSEKIGPIRGRIENLQEENYPTIPLLPIIRTTHDRLNVEVMRGCTRGCRFCHAGYFYRPGRERDAKDVAAFVKETILKTGHDELSLVSLSTSDYTQLVELWRALKDFLQANHLSVSLPSLRPETISSELLQLLKSEKKSGITIAPEAGTQRLRDVINKGLSEEDIFRAVETAFQNGWKLVKLYFMIGLPTETDEDLLGLADLVNRIGSKAKSFGAVVKVSISPFNPKAQTPFQWFQQDDIETLNAKIKLIRNQIRGRNITLNWRNPEVTQLEGIIARGDRRLGKAIVKAWQLGARFDAWSDYFNWPLWLQAFQDTQTDWKELVRSRDLKEPLPWQHLTRGVTTKFLKSEWEHAVNRTVIGDCKFSSCNFCGLMYDPHCKAIIKRGKNTGAGATPEPNWPEFVPNPSKAVNYEPAVFCRIKYAKTGLLKFIGHLDLIVLIQRALRIVKLPLVYSRGFSPHPKITYSPALSLGIESLSEYFDIQLTEVPDFDLKDELNNILPEGLQVLDVRMQHHKFEPFSEFIKLAKYRVTFVREKGMAQKIREFNARDSVKFERKSKRGTRLIDLKAYVGEMSWDMGKKELNLSIRVEKGKTVKVQEVLVFGLGISEEALDQVQIIRTYLGAD